MTKTLTEQYKNKELSGWYYVKTKDGSINHWLLFIDTIEFEKDIEEVLAPVPSYDHFSQLAKKVERLQEQLDIVTEQRNDIHIDKQVLQKQLNEANRIIKKLYKESGNPIGIDYLEKWGVK